jgi:alkylation response protein AidB-like acyl-CoA dehydrogenase
MTDMRMANADLPERARRVGALANEHADYGDEHGKLAQEVVDALHREQLYGMWVPQPLGGSELISF